MVIQGLLINFFLFIGIGLFVQVEEKASLKELFIYSTDGAFDISPWLSLVYGFIPVFGVNTEPSIGYGRAVVHHYWDGL